MLGCQNMTASAATSQPFETQSSSHHLITVVSGEACASSQSHDCCAKKKATSESTTSPGKATVKPSLRAAVLMARTDTFGPAPQRGMRECPLALSRAVAVAKTGSSNQAVATIALPHSALAVEDSRERLHSLSPLARLPNRGHTYLRCCVFLISRSACARQTSSSVTNRRVSVCSLISGINF